MNENSSGPGCDQQRKHLYRLGNLIFLCWLILTNLGSLGAIAQTSDISVVSSVQISIDEPSVRHVESCLAINPRSPRNLVAASIVLGERSGVAVYSSHDGGASWLRATHGVKKGLVFEGWDPALAFDLEGNAYLVTGKVAVWGSTDGGKIWGEPASVPGSDYDRPFISCDVSGREGYRGLVYMSGKLPITVFWTSRHGCNCAVSFARSRRELQFSKAGSSRSRERAAQPC